MGEFIVWSQSSTQIKAYYIVVLFSFIFLIYKYRKQKFSIFIILIFFNGLFAFFGKNVQNGYRIGLVILTFYWIIRTNPFKNINVGTIVLGFLFFTLTFMFSSLINNDYFFIIFSQYSRYFILFSLFFIIKKYCNNETFRLSLEKLVFEVLFVQIVLSIAKYIIVQRTESIVGSISSQGGAIATSLPLLGFIFIWLKKKGKFDNRDWLFVLGLMFIGFASNKRAIWFIMPILIALLMFYVPHRRVPVKVILLSILTVPLVFYIGVRLTPSLNKEGTLWGSFSIGYAINFAENYSFGERNSNEQGTGRGGATMLLFKNITNRELEGKDFFGYGLRFMYGTNYEQFSELGFGIESKGSANGAFQTMVTNGYIGILATVLFALSLLIQTKNSRLRLVLICFFLWEYFFYTGMILREPALSFLLIYIILFSGAEIAIENKKNIEKNFN